MIIFMDECIAQLASETIPPIADGSGCRDPQQDIMWRVSKLEVWIQSLPLEARGFCKKGWMIVETRGDGGSRETWNTESSRTYMNGLMQTKVAGMKPESVYTRSFLDMLLAWCSWETPNCKSRYIVVLFAGSWDFSPCLVALSSLGVKAFAL